MRASKYLKYRTQEVYKIKIILILLIAVFQLKDIQSQIPKDNVGRFQVAFSTNVFKGVYLNDAIAGAKALTESLIKEYSRTKYEVIPPATFSTVEELKSLLNSQEVEVFVLHATELIQIRETDLIEPICTAVRDGSPYDIFFLLVNKNTNYEKLKDLKDKRILIGSPFEGDMPVIWLENLLKQKKLKSKEKYFSSIEYFDKALPAILPVFFNKADACIITKSLYETVTELNPQIKSELTAIEISEPISIGIVAIRKNISNPDLKEDIYKAFINLHKNANGKQYLNIFRIESVIDFKEEYLESTYHMLNFLHK
jgi:ABC-type phosphate/phosphonate transport system substrate-binding protein